MKLEYIVTNQNLNQTINQIIKDEFHLSTRLFEKLIRHKKILLNGEIIDTRISPNLNDIISIDLNYDEDNSNILPTKIDLDILYEDDCLLILNKSAGIPIHPSRMHYENSLSNGVKFYFDSIGLKKKLRPVNRIDLNTSGITIFAKNEYIQECLVKQMSNGNFRKEYLAIITGTLEEKQGIIDAPISRKENSIIERCISSDGKKSITKYEVLKEYIIEENSYSLLKCKLLTGRTHQIRVHFAYIGHPLVGDTLYGNPSNLINRQALHSSKVSFIHPITKKAFEISCKLPQDMKKLLNISYSSVTIP